MILDNVHKLHTNDFNDYVIYKLIADGRWNLSDDGYDTTSCGDERPDVNVIPNEEFSDTGFLFTSFDKDRDCAENDIYPFFNSVGEIILNTYLQRSKFVFHRVTIDRVVYNYYNKASEGVFHKDCNDDTYYSIIYNFNDNDGGTSSDDKFVRSKAGDAILVEGNSWHKGTGPRQSKQRFLVNIGFIGEDRVEKG
jgi:hypothetical protein